MSSQKLLQLLRQKLTIGNRRSIHLNALPGNLLNRVDVASLDLLQSKLASKLITHLLNSPKFSLPITYDYPKSIHSLPADEQKVLQTLQKKLNAVFYENNDNFLEHGTKPFGIGYPLLIKRDRRDPSKIIKAPILIWNLEIEKSNTHAFRWVIRRNDDFAVYLNQVLISHIENDEGITLQNILNQYDLDNPLTEQGIVNLCNQLLQQLNAGEEYPQSTIGVCPGPDTLKHLDISKPILRWSAVLGIFKTQKQSIIKDIDELIGRENAVLQVPTTDLPETDLETGRVEKSGTGLDKETDFVDKNEAGLDEPAAEMHEQSYQQHTFVCVKTDPSQQAVVNNIAIHHQQIIQGPPGTGKSQSLTAVISNALANHAKCLVVCEKRTALEVVQNNLSVIGLGELTVIIEDIAKDRTKVIDHVRNQIETHRQPAHFSEDEYQSLLLSTQKLQENIHQTHQFLAQKLLNHWNWTDLVGKFLVAEGQLEPEEKLNYNDLFRPMFTNPSAEFARFSEVVNAAQVFYEKVNTLQHPLMVVNPMLFLSQNAGELQFLLQDTGGKEVVHINKVCTLIEDLLSDYKHQLDVHYRQFYAQLLQQINELQDFITENIAKYGNSFNQRIGFNAISVKALSLVSGKHKLILKHQQEIGVQYELIKHLHEKHPYFKHQFLIFNNELPESFTALLENITELKILLQQWSDTIKMRIVQETEQLHYSHPLPALNMASRLMEVKQAYLKLAHQQNEQGLLYESLSELTDLPATQLMILKRTEKQWKTVQEHLHVFKDFYDWQRFYLQISKQEQDLIVAIIKLNSPKWGNIFEHWFFHNFLQFHESRSIPDNEQSQLQYQLFLNRLRIMQANKIVKEWHLKQDQSVGLFNTRNAGFNIKQLYNKRGTKGLQRNPLRKIIHADFSLFTNFFPVLLVNPVVCSSILPLIENLFDVVIFDEASQLRLEETYTALLRGKNKIVSGDTHQMPPSSYFDTGNAMLIEATDLEETEELDDEMTSEELKTQDVVEKESLLAYAEDVGYSRSFLDFHYRSQHPYLIDFSNAAFYGSRLVTMPIKQNYKPIRFIEVNGVYDKSTNQAEIDAVMQILLNEIIPINTSTSEKTEYPSIGVATFNIYQRNLLLETIEQHKQKDESIAARFAAYEEKGFFVKNLENIQGDERDIMILTTTFGLKPDGKFIQNFGPINQSKGYKLLNVIITRARQMIYVCTSIPAQFYNKYATEIETSGNMGKGIFYAYLVYAKAIETDNKEQRQSILNLLQKHCLETISEPPLYYGESGILISEIVRRLTLALPQHQIVPFDKSGGFVIDITITNPDPTKPVIAIEVDNSSKHESPEAALNDIYRHEQLQRLGFRFVRLYSINWWLNPEKALGVLVAGF